MKLKKTVRKMFRRVRKAGGVTRQDRGPVAVQNNNREQAGNAVTIGKFSEEMLRMNAIAARRYSVVPNIHPDDFMYWFHVTHSNHASIHTPINYYFDDGAASANKLVSIIVHQSLTGGERTKLLEFASGYGMVTRHLKRYPHIDVVCSDIHNEAVDFLENTLGAKAILSHSQPEEFQPAEKFDVAFALSFFTHMPKVSFGRWLGALYRTLNPGGKLIFTTHGSATLADHPEWEMPADGFLFMPMSEQKDLDVHEYGATIVKPEYVMAQIIENTGSQNIIYEHAGWWTRQDTWIVHHT